MIELTDYTTEDKRMNWWKAVSIGTYILGWLTKASADGRITVDEVIELVEGAIRTAGLDVQIDVPKPEED